MALACVGDVASSLDVGVPEALLVLGFVASSAATWRTASNGPNF